MQPTCKLKSANASLALSRSPLKLMSKNIMRIMREPTTTGKGSVTSPARYDTAVAADTTDVAAKSRSSSDAPIMASVLDEMFNLDIANEQ